MRRLECERLRDCERVIAAHLDLRAFFAKVMREVIGETVVIIDEQEHAALKHARARGKRAG
jgi:hypothetical protein